MIGFTAFKNKRYLITRMIKITMSITAVILLCSTSCSKEKIDKGYDVPLDPASPWPKFRRNAVQDGRSPVLPKQRGGSLWNFKTERGIFSSPVVGGDGTIYVGSADRTFYALNPDGSLRWKFLTGGIIDSAALLDDKGRVYFGSGDGNLYSFNAQTGELMWSFLADDPAVNSAYIRWFEGNVAIGPDGNLYVPNDNYFLYCIDRNTGTVVWKFKTPDQAWSLPAVDPFNSILFFGNNNLLSFYGDNTFTIGAEGNKIWSASTLGSVVASPMLTDDGKMLVGSFDGFLRAYDQNNGELLWQFGTRDHIYSSPGSLPDGTIIQPSADGTIYAIDPKDGTLKWAFDTREPIRSSPAIDADGNIYVGSGDGRLYVLNSDGSLRWSIILTGDERNDLNASPALGNDAIYIAGESGEIFSIPYDYCRRQESSNDSRCRTGDGEDLPENGAFLYYTTQLGAILSDPPAVIDANQILTFSLFVRENGDTVTAVVDSNTLLINITPELTRKTHVSGDRKFIVIAPENRFIPDSGGKITIAISGQYLVNLERDGLLFTGGEPGGSFVSTFSFKIREELPVEFPLVIPSAPGDSAGIWELYRLAAPLPTILPSYNQIGFDSLHFLIGIVEGNAERTIGWVTGGKLAEGKNHTVIDPDTRVLFPVEITFKNGLLTMTNEDGAIVEVLNAKIPFDTFRITTRINGDGTFAETPRALFTTVCSDVLFYGPFLKQLGFCNPQNDMLIVFGAGLMRSHEGGVQNAPEGIDTVNFTVTGSDIISEITDSSLLASEHSFGILLIDPDSNKPVSLDYGLNTSRLADSNGFVSKVSLTYDYNKVPDEVYVYLMVDAYPTAKSPLLNLK